MRLEFLSSTPPSPTEGSGTWVAIDALRRGLERLGHACAHEGRWEFLLVAAPLPVTGAVGGPVNPLAIL